MVKFKNARKKIWLDTKFDIRVISNKMTHVWPPCSPDLSPLDFWFWGYAMHHLKTTKPLTIEQLMVDVNDFASQLDQESVEKAVKDIISRARCCNWTTEVQHSSLNSRPTREFTSCK